MVNLKTLKPFIEDDNLIVDFKFAKEQVKIFYEYFVQEYIETSFEVKGKKIKIFPEHSKIKEYKEYAETFVHLITREIKYLNQRSYDCKRANRIHWVKPILLSHPCKDILYYKWADKRGVCKEHFWLYDKNFMVVLKEVNPNKIIVTAFCVDECEKSVFYERFKAYLMNKGIS